MQEFRDSDHFPVMLNEMIHYLNPKVGDTYIDATFGNGGYSEAILKLGANIIAIDQDPNVLLRVQEFSKNYPNFKFHQDNFKNIEQVVSKENITTVDGVVMDIGVSSMQIDNAERGFSFQKDGQLDMRMSGKGLSAYDVINSYDEKSLADIIYKYGGERKSRAIAAKIVAQRKIEKIDTTFKLANIVRSVVRKSYKNPIDPATRTFQAIRIEVNNELEVLEKAILSASKILSENGRIVVITFHSLEDRIVKNMFRYLSGYQDYEDQGFTIITKKPVTPSESEVLTNPRSRSAKLRAIEKKSSNISDFKEKYNNRSGL